MELSCPEEVFGIPGNSGVDWNGLYITYDWAVIAGSYNRLLKCSPLLPYGVHRHKGNNC
jgi:hypothetical protein